jgi:hypothetical protein
VSQPLTPRSSSSASTLSTKYSAINRLGLHSDPLRQDSEGVPASPLSLEATTLEPDRECQAVQSSGGGDQTKH